jgi:cytoskeletal protein CcmA (bactofilin family)
MSDKKTGQKEVACPHCQGVQYEPDSAISTNCKLCGRYFKLGEARASRAARAPKASREVFCVKCGAPNLVAQAALSTQCIRCLHYLELGDKVVKGAQSGKLYAYDDVVFAEGCSFRGMEATGRRIEVRGKVVSNLRATAEITAFPGSQLSGELHAPLVRVDRGAKVKVQTVECARLQVSGDIEINGKLSANEVVLNDGAHFSGQLHMPEGKLQIDHGVSTRFDSLTCDEIIAGGSVILGEALFARKIVITTGGVLTAPRIFATTVQVATGGTLEGRMEKYDPPPAPERVVTETVVPVEEPLDDSMEALPEEEGES